MQETKEILLLPGGKFAVRTSAGTFPVVTVLDAARRLSRSRRQVYRMLGSGALTLRLKALGECLLDEPAVARLEAAPLAKQRVPALVRDLFPEHDTSALNAGADRDLILSRVLEGGSRRQAAWALRRYGAAPMAEFVRRRGAVLSPRSRAFWEAFFGVQAGAGPAWRRKGLWPG